MAEQPASSIATVNEFESAVSRAYFPFSITRIFDQSNFKVEGVGRNVGGVEMWRLAATSSYASRSRPGAECRSHVLHYVAEGDLRFSSQRRCVTLSTGDLILLDCDEPLAMEQHGSAKALAFKISTKELRLVTSSPESWCLRPVPSERGTAAILRRTMQSYWREAANEAISPGQTTGLIQALLTLIGVSFESHEELCSEILSSKMRHHFMTIKEFIKQNIKSGDLSAKAISAEVGLSEGYIYLIMNAAGTTLGNLVFNLKLEESRRMLLNRAMSDASISEIAAASGFKDLSHFSRRFSTKYGRSPRAYRYAFRH